MRNRHIDAVRGYCLIGMSFNHLFSDPLTRFFTSTFGFCGAAEGFVFLSGLVAGSFYARLAEQKGTAAMTWRAVGRARDIFLTHLVVFLMVLGVSVFLLPSYQSALRGVQHLDLAGMPKPLALLVLGALLLFQPALFDILPMYVLMVLLVPLLVGAWRAGLARLALGISACLWLVGQPGVLPTWNPPAWIALGTFSFLGWQFLFVCGLLLACALRTQPDNWAPNSVSVLTVTLVGVTALFIVRHPSLFLGEATFRLNGAHRWLIYRDTLGPLRVLNFGLVVYLVARICVWLAPRFENSIVHRSLQYLGRHSLQVFAWSVLVAYALRFANHYTGGLPNSARTVIAVAGAASLWVPARIHAFYRERGIPS
jgi:hypothetical protein